MFRTLKTKNILNTLGNAVTIKPFTFEDGCYCQFEAACNDGYVFAKYTKTERIYRNFTHLDKETVTPVTELFTPSSTATIRQMAIRAYNDRHGLILGDNDYYERTLTKIYIKRIGNAGEFAMTQVPDNKMDFVFDTDNPILQGGAPTQYYPPFASAPMIAETTWNGKPCKFYMTADEIEAANYLDLLLLADANTDIHLQSGAKVLNAETYIDDESTYITRLNIDGNTAIKLLNFGRCTPQIQIALNNTPNVNRVELGTTISQQAAQAIADMISASTISGKVYGSCGTYNYFITQAVNDNPNWTREDY